MAIMPRERKAASEGKAEKEAAFLRGLQFNRRRKNIAVLGLLVFVVALLYVLTIVKIVQ